MLVFSGFTATTGNLVTCAARPGGCFSPVMLDLLAKFENKRPEIVFEWKDAETEAESWVASSTRCGAGRPGAAPAYARAWISAR